MENEDEIERSVTATVELVGEYEEIASILGTRGEPDDAVAPVVDDLLAVLDVVRYTGGATKSRITEELPHTVAADVDSESIVHVLRVLAFYDLVELDENTWKPGPALSTPSDDR